MKVIKIICLIIGGVWLGILAASSLIFLVVNFGSWLEGKLENRKNRKNGNLHITVDKNWKSK